MTHKILYLMEGIFDLGIAKSIQNKIDCEIFGLIDVNRFIKKTFEKQNLVIFKKKWYFQDLINIKNKNLDLNYLNTFEKKYHVNLWLLAYKERAFYFFNDYYKFNRDEILKILEQECKLFETILLEINPEFIIIKSPDYQHNILLYEMCKSLGIKTLIMSHTRLGDRYIISEQPDKIDNQNSILKNYSSISQRNTEELLDIMRGYDKQISIVPLEYHVSFKKQFQGSLRFLFKVCNNEYRKYFVNYGRTKTRVLINEISLVFKRLSREKFLNKYSQKKIIDTKFVYFPLHFQPELSTLVAVPFYQNQLNVISNIARSLPIDFILYVKEHPIQKKYGWRDIAYYNFIKELPNVRLIHPSVPNEELIKNCSLVITIAGTPGLQAAFFNKPSIVFSNVGYLDLPSVSRVEKIEDLPKIIELSLQTKVDEFDLNNYVDFILQNSFPHDNIAWDVKMMRKLYYGGFLYDVEIPIETMLNVFQEDKTMFDKLADEYVKKIQINNS